jgi:hypothetical protein
MTLLYSIQKFFKKVCGTDMDHDWYEVSVPNATDNKLFRCARCGKTETYNGPHPPKRDY